MKLNVRRAETVSSEASGATAASSQEAALESTISPTAA